jgi:ATP-dependent Clp protease protease subunit
MGAGYSITAKANAEADIFIYEDVGEGWFGGVSAKQFAKDIKALGGVQTINLHLNSAGGDVFDGFAIYRQLVDHKARVVTHIDGLAASIASVIAMAGNEIKIAEAGFLMIHDAWGMSVGNADDMRKMAETLETTSGAIADVYTSRTKNKAEKVRDWMREETWFTGADAVKEGFADQVMENMKVAAKLDPSRHKYRHLPAALAPVSRPQFDSMRSLVSQRQALMQSRRALA